MNPAIAQIESVLGKLLGEKVIASPDDASLYAKDDAVRSNQGAANPWVETFLKRTGLSALLFVRPAQPVQDALRAWTRSGAPFVSAPRDKNSPRVQEIPVVRSGSTATLEQALVDRNVCLVRGTGPDGDEVSIAAASALSLTDAFAKFRRIERDCRRTLLPRSDI